MRQTLGTGMMAPLTMANNFIGPHYAGPTGLSMGAMSAADSIAEGLVNLRSRQDYTRDRNEEQGERDRLRMDELNQRQAVASAINPQMQMNSSNGMSNRDMTRKMNLPDASTQMGIYKLAQEKQDKAQKVADERLSSLAIAWLSQGGREADPTGSNFQKATGRNPFELIPASVYNSMESNNLRRDIASQSDETRRELAAAVAAGKTPPTPKRELFVDANGQYSWLDEGKPIPKGMEPAKSGAININTGALPTEKAKMVTLAEDGSNSHQVIMDSLFDKETGELDRATATLVRLPGAREGLFGPKVSQLRAAYDNAVRAKLRLESGAAIGDKEQAAEDAKYIPGVNDDAATARAKLEPLGAVLKGYVKNSTGKGQQPQEVQENGLPAGFKVIQ